MTGPSIRLVVPYFGERPSHMPLVIASMARNPDVHWLLLTEAPVPDAPPNVSVQLCEFAYLAARIQGHFDFDISLEHPYKLCDFRPAFGEAFRDELAGYDFWGHSDLDVLFGQIRKHLLPEAFDADKILIQGNFARLPAGREIVPFYCAGSSGRSDAGRLVGRLRSRHPHLIILRDERPAPESRWGPGTPSNSRQPLPGAGRTWSAA